jgi:hypothetical protein
MSSCCPHPFDAHQVHATCQAVIHYPSEDYPCLCTEFRGEAASCEQCEHDHAKHVVKRICVPGGGEPCSCEAGSR